MGNFEPSTSYFVLHHVGTASGSILKFRGKAIVHSQSRYSKMLGRAWPQAESTAWGKMRYHISSAGVGWEVVGSNSFPTLPYPKREQTD